MYIQWVVFQRHLQCLWGHGRYLLRQGFWRGVEAHRMYSWQWDSGDILPTQHQLQVYMRQWQWGTGDISLRAGTLAFRDARHPNCWGYQEHHVVKMCCNRQPFLSCYQRSGKISFLDPLLQALLECNEQCCFNECILNESLNETNQQSRCYLSGKNNLLQHTLPLKTFPLQSVLLLQHQILQLLHCHWIS